MSPLRMIPLGRILPRRPGWLALTVLVAVCAAGRAEAQSRPAGPRVSVRRAEEEILLAQLRMYDVPGVHLER